MNFERVCVAKKNYKEIPLGVGHPSINSNKGKITVYKRQSFYFVNLPEHIEFLLRYGYYGKLMNSSDILSNWNPNEISTEFLILSDIETIYLTYVHDSINIKCFDANSDISIKHIWQDCVTNNGARFISLYVAYHYYRGRNWVVRSGLRFGTDYLLYVASPEHSHASFSIDVKCFLNGVAVDQFTIEEILDQARVSNAVSKTYTSCKVLINTQKELTDIEVLKDCTVHELQVSRFDPNAENH